MDLNTVYSRKFTELSHLVNLKFLERLHLQNIESIHNDTLCEILQSNQQMRDLNLAYTYDRFEKYAIRWTTLCPNLEKLNLERAYLTLQDIDALANFKNLKEVNFSRVYVHNKVLFLVLSFIELYIFSSILCASYNNYCILFFCLRLKKL